MSEFTVNEMYWTMTKPIPNQSNAESSSQHPDAHITHMKENIKAAIELLTIPFTKRMSMYLNCIKTMAAINGDLQMDNWHILDTPLDAYTQRKVKSIETMSYKIFAVMESDLPGKITLRSADDAPVIMTEKEAIQQYVLERLRLFNKYQTKCHEFFEADMARYVRVAALLRNVQHVVVSFDVFGVLTPTDIVVSNEDAQFVFNYAEREIRAAHQTFNNQFPGHSSTNLEEALAHLREQNDSKLQRSTPMDFYNGFNTIAGKAIQAICDIFDEALGKEEASPEGKIRNLKIG